MNRYHRAGRIPFTTHPDDQIIEGMPGSGQPGRKQEICPAAANIDDECNRASKSHGPDTSVKSGNSTSDKEEDQVLNKNGIIIINGLPGMDRKIALDTFTFYTHLLAAERDRNLIFEIQRLGDQRELTSAERNRQQSLSMSFAREVNTSVSLLPALKQELDAAT